MDNDNYLSLKERGLTKRKKFIFFHLKGEANKAELFNYLIINSSVKVLEFLQRRKVQLLKLEQPKS
ncbi:MAG: hypothetical protein F6K39_10845 [Okeania sp. SIO3B3]|nr:hypothetical protein [Okeania sp. SIO3B3]